MKKTSLLLNHPSGPGSAILFQPGERVEFCDRYKEAVGTCRYHSVLSDKVMIDLDNGRSIYVEACDVESVPA